MPGELSPAARAVIEAIQNGHPAVMPMDTVYGLCASPYREEPARRVYRLKGRPDSTPTALVCSDLEMLFECVPEILGRSGTIARALLPGPVTVIFPNPARRYRWLTGASPETIGVRVPHLQVEPAQVLARLGAVMATSANLAGGEAPRRPEEVPAAIREACPAVLDGGDLPGLPSTIVDVTAPEPRILREGAVPAAEVLARVEAALSSVSR